MKRLAALVAIAAVSAAGVAHAADGAALYQQNCVGCHQAGGTGAPGLAPPLGSALNARAAGASGRSYLAQVLVHGLSGRILVEGVAYNGAMPAQAHLSDAEIAAVLDHVIAGFPAGATTGTAVTAADVAAARNLKPSAKDLRALRESSAGQ